MKVPHDFEDVTLSIGDEVIFIPYKGGSLHRGKVTGRSPKQIRMEIPYLITWGKQKGQTGTYEYLRPPEHIYKIKGL